MYLLQVYDIYIDQHGIKWIATNKGLTAYNDSNWFTYEDQILISGFNSADITGTTSGIGDEIWYALSNGAGMIGYNSGVIEYQSSYTTTNSEILSNEVNAVSLDNSDLKWFGTSNGLSVLKNNNWYNEEMDGFYSLFPITEIACDTGGWNFIATFGGGVSRHKMEVDAISGASIYDSVWTGLGSNYVNTSSPAFAGVVLGQEWDANKDKFWNLTGGSNGSLTTGGDGNYGVNARVAFSALPAVRDHPTTFGHSYMMHQTRQSMRLA